MNLTNFLKQTDVLAAQYSAEQLRLFIHDIGRVLPEERREDFLKRLKSIGGGTGKASDKDGAENLGFHKAYQNVRKNLKEIDSREVAITGMLNEEYNDWYDDSGEEFYYEDENGISDMLAEACAFVHTCMDGERYKEGSEIGRQLFSMEILCLNEYGDEELSIGDMVDYELLHCDMEQVLLDTLYCAYHATSLTKRSEVLYEVLANANNNEITLESMMQHGDGELPDFREFLTNWIGYLGGKAGGVADRLFPEAVSLLDDVSAACGYAEEFAAIHPGLYLDILENGKAADCNVMVSIGIQAMKAIPKKYVVRSRVALVTADYVIESGERQELLEVCYFAAYESDTSAMNYIRVLLNGYGSEEKRGELRKVFMQFPLEGGRDSFGVAERDNLGSEREGNKPDGNTVMMLRFLDGQFAEVLEEGLGYREALGWSGTFMKQGIALYLLWLYEGEWHGKGMLAMADMVKTAMGFSAEGYRKGLPEDADADGGLFYSIFSKWKSMVGMGQEIRDGAINRIKDLIGKRTEGIMNANRRNYYGECAAFIAALGEVQESLGDKGAKQRLMESYKDAYSRRSAFRAELKGYGWKDGKRK